MEKSEGYFLYRQRRTEKVEIIMKKSNFVAIILGTIGGILFALGMCMALISEWNAFNQGVVMGVIGALAFGVGMCRFFVTRMLRFFCNKSGACGILVL